MDFSVLLKVLSIFMLFLTLIGQVVQLLEEAHLDIVSILVATAFRGVQRNSTLHFAE